MKNDTIEQLGSGNALPNDKNKSKSNELRIKIFNAAKANLIRVGKSLCIGAMILLAETFVIKQLIVIAFPDVLFTYWQTLALVLLVRLTLGSYKK